MNGYRMSEALEPHDDTAWTLAAEQYEVSDAFDRDAIEWLTDADEIPDDVMAVVCAMYRESSRFATVIDDALEGDSSWE